MTNQSTMDKLIEMRLTTMADAFRNQLNDPKFKEVPFEDQFGILNFQPEIALKASQAEKLHVIGTLNLCFSHTHIMFFRKFKSCL